MLLCGLSNSRGKELLKMKVMIWPQNHNAKNKQSNFNSLLSLGENGFRSTDVEDNSDSREQYFSNHKNSGQ